MVVHGCMWTSGVTCASVLLPHEINMPDARPPFTRERPGSRSTTSSAWPRLSGVPLIVESSHRGVAMRAHIHVIASWSILAYPMQAKERKMPRLPTKPTVRRAQAPKHPLATRTVELSGRHHGGPRQVRPRLGRVCRILLGGVAEPDLDRGDVDGALVDELAFIGAGGHGAELLELVECAFGGVAG
jgi:hypothetical protein